MDKQIQIEIKKCISTITPFDAIEKIDIESAIQWIDSGVEIFRISKPATPSKHLVSYTVFVDPSAQKILLLEHKKALLLLPNGGHVDKNELPHIAAIRELREEMEEDGKFLFGSQNPFFIDQVVTVGLTTGHTDVSLWYLFERDSSKPLNDKTKEFQREFSGYHWFKFKEILKLDISKFSPNMHRFTRKLQLELS